jgi:hypothetical protein
MNDIIVIDMVKDYLIRNNYDGLFNSVAECACSLSDELEPCGEISNSCQAGYFQKMTECQKKEFDYTIGTSKS